MRPQRSDPDIKVTNGFNSRTPCGVRPRGATGQTGAKGVSIHAPRVGCDPSLTIITCIGILFQFTHPVWGATPCADRPGRPQTRFNSRTPCGVRRKHVQGQPLSGAFQFTHPVWGATLASYLLLQPRQCFNSRTPCGVRLSSCPPIGSVLWFQFTHPVWGATYLISRLTLI